MSSYLARVRWPIDVSLAIVAGALDIYIFFDQGVDGTIRPDVGLPKALGVLILAIGAASLIFRRRWPVQVFLINWCVALTAIGVPELQPFAALFIALYTVAAFVSREIAILALIGAVAAQMVQVVNNWQPEQPDPLSVLVGAVVFQVLFPGVIWGIGRYRYNAVRREQELRDNQDVRAEEAVRNERMRLSHELHDIVSHTVSVMTLQAAGARRLLDIDPQRVATSLEVIERAGVQTMNELHRMLDLLRSPGETETEVSVQPQLADLPELIDLARAAGQQVDLELVGDPGELDQSVELACYRIVQEALTNARKYGGTNARTQVSLEWVAPQLVVTVRNEAGTVPDGPVLSTGNGLIGLNERVRLIGGELETGPTPSGGFLVRAVLPVAATPAIRRA